MNLIHGQIVNEQESRVFLERLDAEIIKTLRKPRLEARLVIDACEVMAARFSKADSYREFARFGVSEWMFAAYLKQIQAMLSHKTITDRLSAELGGCADSIRFVASGQTARQEIRPLGVLFHITAGNVDGLPFMSLMEGLLVGNINIIKLPREEGGLTVSLLLALFEIEPALREYVYVFDYSSQDAEAMQILAKAADAIVVWGGDAAVKAVRELASPDTKLIEWGHKISFAYVTLAGAQEKALEKIAENICQTDQLFCSSCQGIFLDTDRMEDVTRFCGYFLPILERVSQRYPRPLDLSTQAQVTLSLYRQKIEQSKTGSNLFEGEDCTVSAFCDEVLEVSPQFRNVWVKPLGKDRLLDVLRPYKNNLQTVALACSREERPALVEQLLKTGIVKISDGLDLSGYAPGEAHDGVFPLRCYTKIISVSE